MKRILLLLLAFALLALPALAESPADPLLEQSCALAQHLGELAASEGYAAVFSTSESIGAIVSGWADGDYSAPSGVQRAVLNADAALNIIKSMTDSQTYALVENLSGAAYDELSRRLLGTLPSIVNGAAGNEVLAAASFMTTQTAFLCESLDTPALYCLRFAHGTPVAVTFQPCQDGAVLAQACFLGAPNQDASHSILSKALAMFRALGLAEFEEVPLT